MQQSKDDRSIGELFSELSRESSQLVRQEVALAKSEMRQKATEAGKDVGFLVAGGALAYAGLLVILGGIVVALGHALDNWWLSAFIVGIVVLAIGGFLAMKGKENLSKLSPAPEQTIETLKEDREWAKEQMR